MILRNLVGVAELALDALRIPLHLVGELLAATLPANGDSMPAKRRSQLTPEQRSLRARIAAHTSWANTADPVARTTAARDGFLARFEREVDPDGVLAPDERARRAEHARKAYMASLAFKSAKARRKPGRRG